MKICKLQYYHPFNLNRYKTKRIYKLMFKTHENVLLKTQSEPLTFQDFVKKENCYVSVRKPARLKLAPKENFNLQKMIEAGVDLKQVDCRILEPKTVDLTPKAVKPTKPKTEQTELQTKE